MIRDPSDGSVRPDPISSGPQISTAIGIPTSERVQQITTSGLPPTSAKAAYLARLEASREWLKSYKPRLVETQETK